MIKRTISSVGARVSGRWLSARGLTGGGGVGTDRAKHFMKGGRKLKTGTTVGVELQKE
jgi:hypothetical protein